MGGTQEHRIDRPFVGPVTRAMRAEAGLCRGSTVLHVATESGEPALSLAAGRPPPVSGAPVNAT